MSDLDVDDEPVPPVPWALEKSCSRRAWCAGMTLALQGTHENSEGKGLTVSRGWYNKEKKPRVGGVTYVPRAHALGLILNFCPWCGRAIRFDKPGVT